MWRRRRARSPAQSRGLRYASCGDPTTGQPLSVAGCRSESGNFVTWYCVSQTQEHNTSCLCGPGPIQHPTPCPESFHGTRRSNNILYRRSSEDLPVNRLRHVCSQGLSALILVGVAGCATTQTSNGLEDFKTDGCSFFPDGRYGHCCIAHDYAYWKGGTVGDREAADEQLRTCVLETTGSFLLPKLVYMGVRIAASPLLPTSYRWGYGWPYRRLYGELTAEEAASVRSQTERYVERVERKCKRGEHRFCKILHALRDARGEATTARVL